MKFFKTKRYRMMDIAIFKWCVTSFALLIGAYFAEFVLSYWWVFAIIGVITWVKTIHFIWFAPEPAPDTD